MIHLIGRGKGYVVVVSAESQELAPYQVLNMFKSSGLEPVELEFMEFDPSVCGGVLLDLRSKGDG